MIINVYDYRSGIDVVPVMLMQDIHGILSNMNPIIRKNAVSEIRHEIINGLSLKGWSGEFRLDVSSKITISSYKNNIGLCLQTGNVGRMYADLLKLQSLFLKGKIKAGIIILPKKELANKIASNMASYERLLRELPIFSQVISMPIVIVGFDVEATK